MPRPRKNAVAPFPNGLSAGAFLAWADALGEAMGRGVARGIQAGLTAAGVSFGGSAPAGARRRGRPPKIPTGGPVPPERLCRIDGCGREARSKGLCSAHYQAERRKQLARR